LVLLYENEEFRLLRVKDFSEVIRVSNKQLKFDDLFEV